MRYLKLIALFLLTVVPTLVKAQVIEWREDKPLTWNDFQGKPDYNRGTVAVTVWQTSFSYKQRQDSSYVFTFNITNVFVKNSAWRKRGYSNEYVLTHEQLHFDINELYTRKLAAALSTAVYTSNYKSEMDSIYNNNRAECAAIEARYDTETKHSDDRSMQYKWQLSIYMELKNLPRNY